MCTIFHFEVLNADRYAYKFMASPPKQLGTKPNGFIWFTFILCMYSVLFKTKKKIK